MTVAELVVRPEEQTPLTNEAVREAETDLLAYLETLQIPDTRAPALPKLVFEDGRELELPPNVFRTLQFVLHHMARGDAIGLVPMNKMLTPNQAAEILNVSRPFLVNLLSQGAIRFTPVGTHRRLRMADVLEYKQRRDRQMLDRLDELANEAQRAGNYFDD